MLPARRGRARVPTPLESRLDIGSDLGVEAWLKREDLIDDLGCGHKTRKLGYVVSEALDEGATVLVTSGSVPSSQCVAVAAAAKQHGIRAHLVYSGDRQAAPEHPQGSYLLAALLGPSITWHERSPWSESAMRVAAVAERERESGEVPYVIEPGISAWPGIAGSVELGLELSEQLAEPERRTWIVAPAGSGGTCLGLSIAAGLEGLPWQVVGVCIGGTREGLEETTSARRRQAFEGLGRDDLGETITPVRYFDGALGAGYDQSTAEELEAMREALCAYQLVLDPNYMLKTYLGLRHLIEEGEIQSGDRVVLVHTGGSLGINSASVSVGSWYRRTLSAYLSEADDHR